MNHTLEVLKGVGLTFLCILTSLPLLLLALASPDNDILQIVKILVLVFYASIGLSQLFFVVPMFSYFRKRGKIGIVQGINIAATIAGLLNAALVAGVVSGLGE